MILIIIDGCAVNEDLGDATSKNDNEVRLYVISTENGIIIEESNSQRTISLPGVPIGEIRLAKPDSDHVQITSINNSSTTLFFGEYRLKMYRNNLLYV
jgi:hypothetical protein